MRVNFVPEDSWFWAVLEPFPRDSFEFSRIFGGFWNNFQEILEDFGDSGTVFKRFKFLRVLEQFSRDSFKFLRIFEGFGTIFNRFLEI